MFSWGLSFFRIDEVGLTFWNVLIPFWLLLALVLAGIVIAKVKWLRAHIIAGAKRVRDLFRRFGRWLKRALTKFKQRLADILRRLKERQNAQVREEMKDYSERQLFVVVVFALSFLAVLFYKIVPEIISRNLQTYPKVNLGAIIIIGLFLIYMFFVFYLAQRANWKTTVLFIIFIAIWYTIQTIIEKNYLGWPPLLVQIIGALVIVILLIAYPRFYKENWISPSFWMWFTVLVMVFLFIGGIGLIDSFTGSQPLIFKLNIEGNTSNRYAGNGTIECKSATGQTYAGSKLSCTITPPLQIESSAVNLTTNTGEIIDGNMSGLSFIAPSNIISVFFDIRGRNESNASIHITTSSEYTFYTPEEAKERNKEFITYLLALLGAIFISIPTMMVNFKELTKKKEDEANNGSQKDQAHKKP